MRSKGLLVGLGLVLASMGMLPIEATAQTSRSGWNSVCRQRCGQADCPRCADQLQNCEKTGCWTEAPNFGGATHCKLNKS